MKIYIKNMACESCEILVKDDLDELGISPIKVELGEIDYRVTPTHFKDLKEKRRITIQNI